MPRTRYAGGRVTTQPAPGGSTPPARPAGFFSIGLPCPHCGEVERFWRDLHQCARCRSDQRLISLGQRVQYALRMRLAYAVNGWHGMSWWHGTVLDAVTCRVLPPLRLRKAAPDAQ